MRRMALHGTLGTMLAVGFGPKISKQAQAKLTGMVVP
jgi:hypothetical protein